MALDQSGKTAILSRMIMPEHHCPYGLRSKDLLERHGFTVEVIGPHPPAVFGPRPSGPCRRAP